MQDASGNWPANVRIWASLFYTGPNALYKWIYIWEWSHNMNLDYKTNGKNDL